MFVSYAQMNYNRLMRDRPPYLWDVTLSEEQFPAILEGRLTIGSFDQDWAARRLIEYGTYSQIIRQIGYATLIANWQRWREKIRSPSRRRGLDFLVQYIREKHPELIRE